ncbi:hypothetical protein ACFSTD_15635 [Novosphingobium colocasiae]
MRAASARQLAVSGMLLVSALLLILFSWNVPVIGDAEDLAVRSARLRDGPAGGTGPAHPDRRLYRPDAAQRAQAIAAGPGAAGAIAAQA